MTTSTEHKKYSKALLIAAFAALYIIWGSTYLGIKYAIETIPPFFMAAVRFSRCPPSPHPEKVRWPPMSVSEP